MHSLYIITPGKTKKREVLEKSEILSVCYHDLFDFPLTFADIIKWSASEYLSPNRDKDAVIYQNGYYFLRGREGLVYKRTLRSRISAKKLGIATKASHALSMVPAVKMVAVTGSLAMGNAADESDIDLFIITGKNLLWTTRILSRLVLNLFGFDLRKAGDTNQKNKLCLNMWMDEADLVWKKRDRNLYTAHEIAQILPIINKNETYGKFLYKNKWISQFWPNAVRINEERGAKSKKLFSFSFLAFPLLLFEKLAFWLQYQYMRSKITREVITKTRAIFHPQDLGSYIMSRLSP